MPPNTEQPAPAPPASGRTLPPPVPQNPLGAILTALAGPGHHEPPPEPHRPDFVLGGQLPDEPEQFFLGDDHRGASLSRLGGHPYYASAAKRFMLFAILRNRPVEAC